MVELNVALRNGLLAEEASRWVGIAEIGGNNKGQLVEIFQRVCALPPGSPWCLAFVQYCVRQVDRAILLMDKNEKCSQMAPGAHCLTVWGSTDPELRSATPTPGSIVIWKQTGTDHGHAGIVTGIAPTGIEFYTIEGNTSVAQSVDRNGDGVYRKTRSLFPTGPMEIQGFISPWGNS